MYNVTHPVDNLALVYITELSKYIWYNEPTKQYQYVCLATWKVFCTQGIVGLLYREHFSWKRCFCAINDGNMDDKYFTRLPCLNFIYSINPFLSVEWLQMPFSYSKQELKVLRTQQNGFRIGECQ